MPFLDNIVAGINDELKSKVSDKLPKDVKFYGIAEQILDTELDGPEDNASWIEKRYPAVIDNHGEAKMIDISDSYPLTIFHRVDNIQNIVSRTGFGDSAGDCNEVANMRMLIIGFRNKVKLSGHNLEALIKDSMSEMITVKDGYSTPMQKSLIRNGTSSFDKLNIIGREYSKIELDLSNLIVIEHSYKIESTWKKGCFNKCGC